MKIWLYGTAYLYDRLSADFRCLLSETLAATEKNHLHTSQKSRFYVLVAAQKNRRRASMLVRPPFAGPRLVETLLPRVAKEKNARSRSKPRANETFPNHARLA